ncbi:MAG: ABC transporter substrate-binding protein [Chloroflexi bacterium]|nr:ABC transporter substrate-binding protein [Chloroflexota bacterium]
MQMIKAQSLLTTSLFVVGLLLASCAPGAAPTPTTKPAPAAPPSAKAPVAATPASKSTAPAATPKPAAEQPRYGGILTSWVQSFGALDPQQESGEVYQSIAAMYSHLVQADPLTVDKFVPGLGEKWQMSQDGLTWTFDIRQGVKFHDGSPFAVDDAVFTVKRLTDPPRGIISNAAYLLKPVVKSIDKDGNKAKVTLQYPFAMMLETLAMGFSAMYSEKYLQKNNDMKTSVMGTGPFKLKSFTPGIGVEGIKNPDFWVKGHPYLDGYRVLIIRDAATRISALRTGKVNMTGKTLGALPPSDMEKLSKENPDFKFYPTASVNGAWFFMNTRKPPFQDQKVRKAIHLAVDRQAALKVVAEGRGLIGQPFPLGPWPIPAEELDKMPGYRQPKAADVAEAKKLMRDAGYPDGFELTVLARPNWQSKNAAVFMTDQLAQLGIKTKVSVLEDAIFWDTGRKAGHEAMVYTPLFFLPDPHTQGRFWAPGGALSFAGNDNDQELIKMWNEQIRIVDQAQRKAIIRRVAEHLLEALPGVPMVWYHVFIGVRPEVRNFTPGISDYVGNTLEEIWLAK